LYRSNFISREIEQKLISKQIPYQIFGGFKFYQRKEVKDALSYLRAVENLDEISLKRIINVPSRKISEETVEILSTYSKNANVSFYQALREVDNIDLRSLAKNAVKNFVYLIDTLNTLPDAGLVDKFKTILDKTKYLEYLSTDLVSGREDNIKELLKGIEVFAANNPDAGVNDFLNEISLYTTTDETPKENCLSMMTIHASKGLEFSYVFVAGLSEGLFPSRRSSENDDSLEEERRIAYVAITRCKKALYISSTSEYSFVANENTRPSRFIKEIGENNIHLKNQDRFKGLFGNRFTQRTQPLNNTQPNVVLADKYHDDSVEFHVGEMINHTVFGDGIIEKVYGNIIEVAFPRPIGIKTLLAKHKAITKKKH
jgi:DNA helicase-2/ATP-dependent DNA helicase PcrA